jgi:hypothetical protein
MSRTGIEIISIALFDKKHIHRVLMQSKRKLDLLNKLDFRRNIKLYGGNTDYK